MTFKRKKDNWIFNEKKGDIIYCPICYSPAVKQIAVLNRDTYLCDKKECELEVKSVIKEYQEIKRASQEELFREYQEFIKYYPNNDGGSLKRRRQKVKRCTYCNNLFTHPKNPTCSKECARLQQQEKCINRFRRIKGLTDYKA